MQSGFREEFEAPRLNARWAWRVPVPGPTYRLQDGRLLLSVPARPGGYNHWTRFADAPILTTALPDGDWDFEGLIRLVRTDPAGEYHCGLVIGFNPRYMMIWGPYQSKRFAGTESPQIWLECTGEGRMAVAPMPGESVALKIEKRGAFYTFWLRGKEQSDWQQAAKIYSLISPQFIGIGGKTFAEGESKPLTFEVDYLAFTSKPAVRKEQPLPLTIRVTPEGTHQVDPMIYGHFIEHLGRCIQGGIWAERLTNRKFAGNVQPNGVIEGWEPVGKGRFEAEHERVYVGGQAQTVRVMNDSASLSQRGLGLIKGKTYHVRAALWAEGRLRVGFLLQGAVAVIDNLKPEWQTVHAQLTAPENTQNGRFEVMVEGWGTLYIGCVSLMPADNVHGFRKDVIEVIKRIKPPIVRWPGGNFVSGYDWREGIGDPDKRPPRWERAWNAWEMNDMGTDEFIQFCRLIGAEPYICVNAGEGTPHEAAEWVEYCNGSSETPMGKLRAQNGHPEPYRVRYWGTGNEMYGDWQLGHLDAVKYGLKAVEFARAMRAVDPNIKLILVGVEGDGWGDWNRKVLQIAGGHHDYLSVHFYKGADAKEDPTITYQSVVTTPFHVERSLARTAEIIREVMPNKPLPIAFDEWNTWYANARVENGLEQEPPLCDGLFSAGIFHAMIRLGDRVTMGNLAQLVNVLGAMRVSQTAIVRTPTFLAFEMYAPYLHGRAQSVVVPQGMEGLLDVVAVLSEDGKQLAIGLINRSLNESLSLKFQIEGFLPARTVRLLRMEADRFDAVNSFENPNAVRVREEQRDWSDEWALPPHSVTVILQRRQ